MQVFLIIFFTFFRQAQKLAFLSIFYFIRQEPEHSENKRKYSDFSDLPIE